MKNFELFLNFLALILTYCSILGYSFVFKLLFFDKKNYSFLNNLDIFFGISLLIFLSIFLNFFSPLNNFNLSILVIGIVFFFYFLKKYKFYHYNFKTITFIIIFLFLISHSNGLAYDSSLYHLQIIKFISDYKIIFGLTNIESRLGLNSSWYYFLSIFNIKNYHLIYLINIIIYAIFINELFVSKKERKISFFFLFFSISFLLFFSLIHPTKNGIILNNIGSPEVDTMIMLIFIINFYIFLKSLEKYSDQHFYLILTTTVIAITTKISAIPLFLLLFFIFIIYFSKIRKINNISYYIFNLVLAFFWLISNFIKTGCFIFPISITCLNVTWGFTSDNAQRFINVVQSFARDTRLRQKFNDFNYTLDSYNWVIPWFNDYYLNTSLLKIVTFIILSSLIFIIIFYLFFKRQKSILDLKYSFCIFTFFFLSLVLWFRAPEVRFGYGFLVSSSCFLLTIVFLKIRFLYKYVYYKQFILIICFLLIVKNFNYFKNFDQFPGRDFSYKDFELIKIIDGNKIYYPGDNKFCNYSSDICIYQKEFQYNVKNYNTYTFINK